MNRGVLIWGLLIAGLLSMPMYASAQSNETTSAQGQEVDDDEIISVSTAEVLLPVTVRDRYGKIVTNLAAKDFRVFEDSKEQPVSDLRLRQVPVDVVLMVDSSSSASSYLDDFKRAAGAFAQRLGETDRISLIKFDDRVELLQDWTTSRFQLSRALSRVSSGVFTKFNDALMLAGKEQLRSGGNRHAVVALTDGVDSGLGFASFETAVRALLESQATVYVISNTQIQKARKQEQLDDYLAQSESSAKFNQTNIEGLELQIKALNTSEQTLKQLCDLTGGRLFIPTSFSDLDSIYNEIAEELRSQYALYYSPLDRARDGRFRRTRVDMMDSSLKASARVGYFAPKR
jgi:Ca-activated chloride channel homolog